MAQDRAARIEAVLTAVDATVHQEPAAGSGTVMVIGMTSAGVLSAGETSAIALVTGLAGADLVGVSVEPAGGSPTPTQIVVTVPLT